jgi:hypothetical protein
MQQMLVKSGAAIVFLANLLSPYMHAYGRKQ